MQQTHQDAAQLEQADPSSNFPSRPSSSATTPLNWTGGDWSAEAGGRRPSKKNQSNFLGLTSASVLEDTPGNFRADQDYLAHFSTESFPVDSEHLSQRLETEAAKQRACSPLYSTRLILVMTTDRLSHTLGRLEASNYCSHTLDFDGVDPDLAMHLLSCHWNRQHHSYLITYRPAFMRDMACQGPYFSKLLLNAIYFGASKFTSRGETRSDPADVRPSGWVFRQRVKELLVSDLEKSTVTTIQALLIMTRSLFALGEEKNAAWMYAGMAFRMMVDLGMHIEGSSLYTSDQLSDEDLEIRRRVFWAAFGMSTPQGSQRKPHSDQDWQ